MTHAKRTYPCIAPALRGRQARASVRRAKRMERLMDLLATVCIVGVVLWGLSAGGLAQ